ncbi:rhodanese-like domain-containing protein [Nocardioides euryhalodurans]|uniref:rhodanese-like domain-containing protein n=1 Tax=Nocardioides euryhalodurans TaxID=2518370 RepID=UPI001FC9495C|nr:rhodanese-like domain-containing protein [Nocardioides euryhalodurans]
MRAPVHLPVPTVTVDDLPQPLPGEITLLDVREQVEWDHGHIDGATHLPLMELVARVDEVPSGRVVVVCKVGARSAQATAYLSQQGHDVVNLDGGMLEWAAAGRPMVSATGRPPQVV